MNSELPAPNSEGFPAPPANGENASLTHGHELFPVQQNVESGTTERPAPQEVRNGQGSGDSSGSTFSSGATLTTNSAYQPAQPSTPAPVSLDDVPVVAADEDLIEKQWVDSAKRIIKETRNDPYSQGQAISRLQADYLQKRYGKSVGQGTNAS